MGELDPETGKQIRHYTPRRGGMLQVVTDKDDNIWFGMVKGPGGVGELVRENGVVHQWQTPTPDNLIYGLAVNPVDGTIWGAGYSKGQVTEFDPKTEEYTEYYAPARGDRFAASEWTRRASSGSRSTPRESSGGSIPQPEK